MRYRRTFELPRGLPVRILQQLSELVLDVRGMLQRRLGQGAPWVPRLQVCSVLVLVLLLLQALVQCMLLVPQLRLAHRGTGFRRL